MWQVRGELEQILGSADAVETGGYRVITTLDWHAQQIAEHQLDGRGRGAEPLADSRRAPAHPPQHPPPGPGLDQRALRGKDLHNAALVAIDYRTGDVRAYVGSAAATTATACGAAGSSPSSTPRASARASLARRSSPSSTRRRSSARCSRRAPCCWTSRRTSTAGSTGRPRTPTGLERGPGPRAPGAPDVAQHPGDPGAPAGRQRTRSPTRRRRWASASRAASPRSCRPGSRARSARSRSGRSTSSSAYGTIANGGVHQPPRMILEIRDRTATSSGRRRRRSAGHVGVGRLPRDGHPQGQHGPVREPDLGREARDPQRAPRHAPSCGGQDRHGHRRARPVHLRLPRPTDQPEGAGAGHRRVDGQQRPLHATRSSNPAISLTAAAPLWRSFVRQLTAGQPVTDFVQPGGLVRSKIDAWSGGAPGPWTRQTRTELFRVGTQPGPATPSIPRASCTARSCGTWAVDPLKAELGPRSWDADVANWLARARSGVGVGGALGSRTAFFWGRTGWGGPLIGACFAPSRGHGNGHGNGHGHGHGHGPPGPGPGPGGPPGPPPASPAPAPRPRRRPTRTIATRS